MFYRGEEMMSKKTIILSIILSNAFPIIVGYSVFYILLTVIKQVPAVGQEVLKLWFIPFSVLTAYDLPPICRTLSLDI